ncbi:MAG: hypothetical protein WA364_09775 [Candidatus Nitrosopolaris sp.]
MEAPLNAALAQLNRSHDTPACNQLNAFLNQVNAKQTNRQLTPQQAAELTQQAKTIQLSDVVILVGCSDKLISYSITWVPVIMAEMTIMTMTILRIGLTLVVESLESV